MNTNDIGYGKCPACKVWKELTRYHPKDKKLPRKKKKRYCVSCANKATDSKQPFYRIKRTISNHRTTCKEGDYNLQDLLKLHASQGGKCGYCDCAIPYEFSIEHIVPRKFGGRNLLFNILLICPKCNSKKQHFELFFWLEKNKLKLRELVIRRVKGAYDEHDYECEAECVYCRAEEGKSPFCKSCPIPKDRVGKTPAKAVV